MATILVESCQVQIVHSINVIGMCPRLYGDENWLCPEDSSMLMADRAKGGGLQGRRTAKEELEEAEARLCGAGVRTRGEGRPLSPSLLRVVVVVSPLPQTGRRQQRKCGFEIETLAGRRRWRRQFGVSRPATEGRSVGHASPKATSQNRRPRCPRVFNRFAARRRGALSI